MYQQVQSDWNDPNGENLIIMDGAPNMSVFNNPNGNVKVTTKSRTHEIPRRGLALQVSIAINSLAVCGGVVTFLCQFISIAFRLKELLVSAPLDFLYQSYGLFFSVLIVLIEFDMPEIVRASMLLQSWTLRGIFYIFVGMFVMENHIQYFPSDSFLYLSIVFSGPFVVFIGLLYLVMVSVSTLHYEEL